MRVGVLLSGFSPEQGGGHTFQADVFRAFAAEAASARHTFVALCDSEAVSKFAADCGIRTARIDPYGARERVRDVLKRELPITRRLLRGPSRIERAARNAGVELVWHLDGGVYEAMDLPYIATVWDLMHRSHPWFPEVSAGGLWHGRDEATRVFLQRAVCVIVGTDAGAEEVREYYQLPRERIRKLPHPTPTFALESPSLEGSTARSALGKNYLLYPAQLWAHKNHAALLLALARLRDEHDVRFELALAGADKGNLPHLRQLAEHCGVLDQVRFLGFVSQDDLVSLYRGATALVYPSFCGPENLPPLEAFALGCPVIAADIPGTREQLEDAAILVDPTDAAAISDAILAVCRNPDLAATLVRRGRERAQRWTGRDYVRGAFAIFDGFEPVRRCWAGPLSSAPHERQS